MSAGMDHARGGYVALLHADLQDPPELIPEMLVRARNGADVVYARRIGRDESLLKRTLATAFYRSDGADRAHAVSGAGRRLPPDVAARRRRAADDARAAPLPARHGRVGRLRAGADRVPPRRPARGPRRLLPGADTARARGDHVVLRRAAAARELPRRRAVAVQRAARGGRARADRGRGGRRVDRDLDPDRGAVPRRRAARERRHHRPLPRARARPGARPPALPRRPGRDARGAAIVRAWSRDSAELDLRAMLRLARRPARRELRSRGEAGLRLAAVAAGAVQDDVVVVDGEAESARDALDRLLERRVLERRDAARSGRRRDDGGDRRPAGGARSARRPGRRRSAARGAARSAARGSGRRSRGRRRGPARAAGRRSPAR